MKKFEYKVIESFSLTEQELDYWGIDGWELIAIQPYGTESRFHFKREISQ